MGSVNDWEDVIVYVETASTIGANVEYLSESELFRSIHAQVPAHENDDAAWQSTILNVRAQVSVLNVLKSEGLDFFWDVLESDVGGTSIGHLTCVLVEVDKSLSLLSGELHDFEVFF